MATIVQSKFGSTVSEAFASSIQLTFDSPTSAGSLIAVVYQVFEADDNGTTRTYTAADNKGAGYSVALQRSPVDGENAIKWRAGILYFPNTTGGSAHTVTIESTEDEFWVAGIVEISGLKASDVLFGTQAGNDGTGASLTGGTAITPDATGVHFALFAALHETANSYTAGSGWTEIGEHSIDTGFQSIEIVQRSAVGSVNQTATATASTATDAWMALHVVFLDAEGGPNPATLSNPTPSGTLETQTTATIGCTTDQNSGTLYVVVDSAANMAGITDAQIIAGTNANDVTPVFDGSGAISTTSPSVGATDMAAGTPYSYAAVQTNANGNSNVVTGTFTTAAVPLITATITGTLIDESGDPVVSASGITVELWEDVAAAVGEPDQTLTNQATNGSGEFSWEFAIGSLEGAEDVFVRYIIPGDPPTQFGMGVFTPTYG